MQNKIIFLGKLPPPYIGPAIATRILLDSDLAKKYNLIHLDTSDHGDINKLGAYNLKNIVLPFMHYFKLLWLIIEHKPTAVYFPNAQTTIAYLRDIPFILIAKLFRKKVIGHLHGGNFRNWYEGASYPTRWLVRHIHPMIDAQIVLGNVLLPLFDWLLPPRKLFVVPNGGDFPLIEKSGENIKKNGTKKRVLFLANFIRSKGILEVLYAAPIILQKYPEIEFVFAGSWNDKQTQLEFIQFLHENSELPVSVSRTVVGADKFNLLASADIFVFPTYYINEGHPYVLVEAMAAGLPIISTDHGAIKEMVFDGINGYLVDKKSPPAIAEKILVLLDNEELRIKMGRESRRIYNENLTASKMSERMDKVFNEILNKD